MRGGIFAAVEPVAPSAFDDSAGSWLPGLCARGPERSIARTGDPHPTTGELALRLKDFGAHPELHGMATHELPDFDELAVRLVQLEREEGSIEQRLSRLMDRNGQFPNEVTARQIGDLQKQHLETRRELNTVRARLVPILRTL